MGGKPRNRAADDEPTAEQIEAADEWVAWHVAHGAREIVGAELVAVRAAEAFQATLDSSFDFPQATEDDDPNTYVAAFEAYCARIEALESELRHQGDAARGAVGAIAKLLEAAKNDQSFPGLKTSLQAALDEASTYSRFISATIHLVCKRGGLDGGSSKQAKPTAALHLWRLGLSKRKIANLLKADRKDVRDWLTHAEDWEGELIRSPGD